MEFKIDDFDEEIKKIRGTMLLYGKVRHMKKKEAIL